jgi:pimeloyl-ACP methyl ester carboxylesterase
MRLFGLIAALLVLAGATPAAARTFGCEASTNCTDDTATGCTIFESRADGVQDYYYYRLPDAFDPSQAYPLLLWFHAMGQASDTGPSPNDDCIISAGNLMVEMANGGARGLGAQDMIVLGLSQRGTQDFLGDFCQQDCPTPAPDDQAAKADMLELIDQLVARFRVSYVITAGASMGGYVALRLAQLDPDHVHVVLGSAPALHRGRQSVGEPGENGPGSTAIEQAFAAGLYDEKLVFDLIGLADENYTDIVLANQALAAQMAGKPWWQYGEEQGVPHVNHFTDDYLCLSSGGFRSPDSRWPPLCDDAGGRKPFLQNVAYGCQHPGDAACGYADPFTTDRIWEKVRAWEAAHPAIAGGELRPRAGWQVPAADGWYLEQAFYAQGGKDPAAVAGDGGVPAGDGGVGPEPNQDGGAGRHDAGGGGGGGGDGGGCSAAPAPAGAGGCAALVLALALSARGTRRRPGNIRPSTSSAATLVSPTTPCFAAVPRMEAMFTIAPPFPSRSIACSSARRQ